MASGIFSYDVAMANVIRDQQARADAINAQALFRYQHAAKTWQDAYIAKGGRSGVGPAPIPPFKQVLDDINIVASEIERICPTVEPPVVNFVPSIAIASGINHDPSGQILQILNWHSQMLIEIGRLLGSK